MFIEGMKKDACRIPQLVKVSSKNKVIEIEYALSPIKHHYEALVIHLPGIKLPDKYASFRSTNKAWVALLKEAYLSGVNNTSVALEPQRG